MKVVVTGATGFIGAALVRALLDRGDEVVALTRDPSRGRGRVDGRASLERWGDDGAVALALSGAGGVVHLAGENIFEKRWSEARRVALQQSRIDTTARLVALVREGRSKGAGPRVLVSGSAVGIYGMREDDATFTEADRPSGGDFLSDLCLGWERAAAPAAEAGVRVCHPRLGIVVGAGGGALDKMLTPFRLGVGGPIGSGRQWMSWVHLQDAVAALLFALDEASFDGPFNVTAPTPVTARDFARALGRALGRPAVAPVPGFALRLALGRGRASAVLTGQRVLPRRLLDAGFVFTFPTLDGALADVIAGRDHGDAA